MKTKPVLYAIVPLFGIIVAVTIGVRWQIAVATAQGDGRPPSNNSALPVQPNPSTPYGRLSIPRSDPNFVYSPTTPTAVPVGGQPHMPPMNSMPYQVPPPVGPSMPFGGYPGAFSHPENRPVIVWLEDHFQLSKVVPNEGMTQSQSSSLEAAHRVLNEATATLKSLDASEDERNDARKKIASYLRLEFQADQSQRREHLKRLERQVENLKKQLDKRDDSLDKMIELRIELLENEAAGLSFPSSWLNLQSGPNQFPHYNKPGPYSATTPSPYYMQEDVEYFRPNSTNKLNDPTSEKPTVPTEKSKPDSSPREY